MKMMKMMCGLLLSNFAQNVQNTPLPPDVDARPGAGVTSRVRQVAPGSDGRTALVDVLMTGRAASRRRHGGPTQFNTQVNLLRYDHHPTRRVTPLYDITSCLSVLMGSDHVTPPCLHHLLCLFFFCCFISVFRC